MKKPKCSNPHCCNDGWVGVGEGYYCGECVVKMDKKQKEKLKKEMEKIWE